MTPQRMLLVNSNPDFCRQLQDHLTTGGWKVMETSDGAIAIDLARRHQPDVILLELSLRGSGSETVARALKLDPLTCSIPIVVMSSAEGSAGGLEPWAADVLAVTATFPVLLAKVQYVLSRHRTQKPFVLVVDDEPDLVEILTALLNERGFAASGALNGLEALEVLRSVQPDAILLDLDMPKMNGWEFLYRLKANAGLRPVKIVILTGKDQSADDRRQGLMLGASDYLLKPCAPDEIIRAIQTALGTPAGGLP